MDILERKQWCRKQRSTVILKSMISDVCVIQDCFARKVAAVGLADNAIQCHSYTEGLE